MGVLDSVLSAKPLKPWQETVVEEGRSCRDCGAIVAITAPVSDEADMLRLHCDECGWLGYEFPPTVIRFEDLKG